MSRGASRSQEINHRFSTLELIAGLDCRSNTRNTPVDLDVHGGIRVRKNACIRGNIHGDNIYLEGNASAETVDANTFIGETMIGNCGVFGTITADHIRALTFEGDLFGNVCGNITADLIDVNTLTVGNLQIEGNLEVECINVSGNVVLEKDFVVGGNLVFEKIILESLMANTIISNLSTANCFIANTFTSDTLDIDGDLNIGGNLSGMIDFAGNLDVKKIITNCIVSNTFANQDFTTNIFNANCIEVSDDIAVTGDLNIGGNLSGMIDFSGNLDIMMITVNTVKSNTIITDTSTANIFSANVLTIDGNLTIGNINGTINGNINGDLLGNVKGCVLGNVKGDLLGNVKGCVLGNVKGDLLGNVKGDLFGNVKGDLFGNVKGDVIGDVLGNLNGDVIGNVKGCVLGNVKGDLLGNVKGDLLGNVKGDVIGDVLGNLSGDVLGNVKGCVLGNVKGDLLGNVRGDVLGNVKGDVLGNLSGDVLGNVKGCVLGNVKGDLLGNIIGGVIGNIQSQTVDVTGNLTVQGDLIVGSANIQATANISGSVVSLDPALMDAFGRQKVSNPFTLLDNKFLTTDEGDKWDMITEGNATIVHSPGHISLSVTGNGDKAIRQSRLYTPYQPGKGLTILATGTLEVSGGVNGVISRIGYFDDGNCKVAADSSGSNGYYFELDGNALSVVERSDVSGNVIETRIPQSSWNCDKFDGTGPSGIVLDPSKRQIFMIELEWLGVGTAVLGLFIGRKLRFAHTFLHANRDSTLPYISRPTLPVRYEIESTAGAAKMIQICSTVLSDGGFQPTGQTFSIGGGAGDEIMVGTGSDLPLTAIRLRPGFRRTTLSILRARSFTQSGGNFILKVWRFLAPTTDPLTGGTWGNVDSTYSAAQINTTATSLDTTDGILLDEIYVVNQVRTNLTDTTDRFGSLVTSGITGNTDVIVLTGMTLSGSVNNVVGGFQWQELE